MYTARYLGAEGFGINPFCKQKAFTGIFGVFSDLSFTQITQTFKYTSEQDVNGEENDNHIREVAEGIHGEDRRDVQVRMCG